MRALWIALFMVGCAGQRTKAGVDPTPSWATKSGRVEAKIELAEALVLNGTPEAALQMISQMVEAGVSHPDLFVLQGRALTDMGLIEEAEIALSMATRRAPSHAEAQNRLGILYMDQQRTDEAIKRFRVAARSASGRRGSQQLRLRAHGCGATCRGRRRPAHSADARWLAGSHRNNLGFALAVTGQDKAAWRVLRSSANEGNARYNLALAQEMRGDNEAALESYRLAIKADPGLDAAAEAVARLTAPDVESQTEEP